MFLSAILIKNMNILFFMVLLLLSILSTSNIAYGDSVPDWVKNNAGWWADGLIPDSAFTDGIEFLIKDGIIVISDIQQSESQTDGIPEWVKNNAGWWATGSISEKEFLNAIEYLVKFGIINIKNSICNENEDANGDGIPDEIVNIKKISDLKFDNKNWSNCLFVGDLSYIDIFNSDLRNTDFSNAVLINAHFERSNLTSADFSNTILYGATFFKTDLINVNFDNADFSPNAWDRPFFTFTYTEKGMHFSSYLGQPQNLSGDPPYYRMIQSKSFNDPLYAATFGKHIIPANLRLVDQISDESDTRTIWRHVADFTYSKIENSTFNNSDLSYVNIFGFNKISNVDFSHANMSGVKIYETNLRNVILNDEYFEDDHISIKFIPEKISDTLYEIKTKQFSNTGIYSDIKFNQALDDIPINWSMGMLIHDQKFYVADTDNHRIIIFDGDTLEQLFSFTSPIQNFCDGVNTFTPINTVCPNNLRNLPTSLAIINENIFVAYGFQNMIQVFDMNGEFLHSFGESGNQPGELIEAYKISASEDELFVSDSGNRRIQVFDTEGNFLRQFSTDMDDIINSRPVDVVITDNRIYVAESSTSSILIFDMDGNFLKRLILDEIGLNTLISGIDVSDEIIFVTDSNNDKILIFDIDGNKIMHFGNSGDHYGEFNNPKDIVSDGKRIFVSDTYNYRIQIFDLIP